MEGLFRFFEYFTGTYGPTFGIVFLIFAMFILGIFFTIKIFPGVIRDFVQNATQEYDAQHSLAHSKRRTVTKEIMQELSRLVNSTHADRAILWEFSNGSSNLAGLPFLFLNATAEVLSYGTVSAAHIYQKINISLLAPFIEELEGQGYYFIKDVEDEKFHYPVLHTLIISTKAKSLLYYPVYGENILLGIIVLSTVNREIEKDEALVQSTKSAQVISGFLSNKKPKK